MGKDEVLAAFEVDLTNPGAYKSGEYLEELVLRRASQIIKSDRQGLIEALEEWLKLRSEPLTMLAVDIAGELEIVELKPQILDLRKEVADRRLFFPYYLRRIDMALDALQ